ncbi:MAG: VRR-NUC domain-containing protein [Lachnospiraceae bacterium]|nr:VRR-NUC domain-containing protein [Lachnospiraceae bacterium]
MERERDVERKLKKRVESTGGWCLKFLSSISGVPDRICLFPGGKAVFVELKRHGEKPRPLQQRVIGKIRKLGFRVEVIDSEEGIQELIKSLEEAEDK